MNVLEDPAGWPALRRLGADSVPVLARGGAFVYAQAIDTVADFLGVSVDRRMLPPAALIDRLDTVLAATMRYVRQIPDDRLAETVRGRERTYLALGHHVFAIAEAFLGVVEAGRILTYEDLTRAPPDDLRSGADVAAFGGPIRDRLGDWWQAHGHADFDGPVDTYFGSQSLIAVLERTAWHAAQHARQLMAILDSLGIDPDGPLTADDLAGLPLPEQVWDD